MAWALHRLRPRLPIVNPSYDPEANGSLTPTMHTLLGTFVESFRQFQRALPEIPPGALDSGLARVMAEESEGDPSIAARLMEEADASMMFARLLQGVIDEWHHKNTDRDMQSASSREFAARLFRAGFLMGCEDAWKRLMDTCAQPGRRHPEGAEAVSYILRYADASAIPEIPRGSVGELLMLWRLLESPQKDTGVAMDACWWSGKQVEEARRLFAAERNAQDGGAR